MYISPETRAKIDEIVRRSGHLYKFLDVPAKQERIAALEAKMSEPDFWNDQQAAQGVISESTSLKATVTPLIAFLRRVEDLQTLAELIGEMGEDDAGASDELDALDSEAGTMLEEIDTLEISSFLSGPHDKSSAIVMIKAGAGGTEACDWAGMLMRMYMRWGERRGFKVSIEDLQDGEGAGISTAVLRFDGENAYGYVKAERGVHRLVRISPFDANKRRHTSFASVDIVADIKDDINVEIKDEDLRIDVYRASGAGGQHVNRTESAVRLTHLPSGIVVECQEERSQFKNRDKAMKMLRARLYDIKQREQNEQIAGSRRAQVGTGDRSERIRTYNYPQNRVTDHRIGLTLYHLDKMLNGDIDELIDALLTADAAEKSKKEG